MATRQERPPLPVEAVAWSMALAGELVRLPATLRQARELVATLPDRLDQLTVALDRTTAMIDATLPAVPAAVAELHTTLHELTATLDTSLNGTMVERIEHLDQVVSDLGRTLTALIGSIPGARRALKAT